MQPFGLTYRVPPVDCYQCPRCGKIGIDNFPEWRLFHDQWQHYHDWPIHYVDCIFIGKNYKNGKRILKF
jgi:hypothetical protein